MPSTKATNKDKKATKARKAAAKKPVTHARDNIDMDQHIYISVPRISNCFDKFGINETITVANDELRRGEPRKLVDSETGEETTTALVPIESMSKSTQELLEQAKARYDKTQEKRKDTLNKKKETLTFDWENRQVFLQGQLASKKIKRDEYDSTLAKESAEWTAALASVDEDLETPPQLINKKKRNHTVYEEQMALIQKMRYRISKDVGPSDAAACTIWTVELLRHGMDNVVNQGKSFLKCQHIFNSDLSNLTYLPFYEKLPTFLAAQQNEVARVAAEEEKKRNKNKKKLEAAKAKRNPEDAEVVVEEPEEPAAVVDDTDDDDDEHSVKFNHHIKQTCLYIQKSLESEKMTTERLEAYQGIRISEEIKTFVSNLISEFNGTLISLIQAELDKTSITTVTVGHIHHALRLFLLCNNNDPQDLIAQVEESVKLYNAHQSDKNEVRKAKAAEREAVTEDTPTATEAVEAK